VLRGSLTIHSRGTLLCPIVEQASRGRPLNSGVRPINKFQPIHLRVIARDSHRAWTDNIAHTRNILVSMLRAASPIGLREAKRLIKSVIAGEPAILVVHEPNYVQPIRNALQSIGVEVEVVAP